MNLVKQILMGAAVLAVALYVWINHVPSAGAFLDRWGVLAVLGLEPQRTGDDAETEEAWAEGPVAVNVAAVGDRALADRVTAIGDGQALRSVTVRSDTEGRITAIGASAGSRVEQGATLVRLEDEAEMIALERARIILENAQDEDRRVSQLGSAGAVTEVRRREAALALREAELALREAQFDLDQRRIRAPISGWVGIIDIEVGDRISPQETLFIITDRSEILIDFRVPERVIGKMAVGMPISVTPLGLRDLVLEGEISAIDTIVDRASRTLRVQGRLDNADDLLRVGMAFSVALNFPGETLLSVDPLAVQWSSDGAFVWRIVEGRAEPVPVTIRQRERDTVLVEGALSPGDLVVTEGVQNLRPGSAVSIRNHASAGSIPVTSAKL